MVDWKDIYQTKNIDPSEEVSRSKVVVEGHFICILLNFSMTMVLCIYV